jgi:hypothetical protein
MLAFLAGCAGSPAYAPPTQVSAVPPSRHIMMAADPEADVLIVADIGPLEGGRFRWTRKNPAVKLELQQTNGLKLRARFWVAADALKAVGPIGIRYFINGNELARASYSNEGEQVFEQPVDPGLLHTGANEVRMELDKIYQRGDAQLGVSLAELGFTD